MNRRFFTNLDPSFILEQLRTLTPAKNPQRLLGSGSCFHAFHLKPHYPDQVLKIAHDGFPASQSKQRQLWLKAMQQLQRLSSPMIPAVYLAHHQDMLGYVVPYGHRSPPRPELASQLDHQIERLHTDLATADLQLGDAPQIVWVDEQPLVTDLSELRPLEAQPGRRRSSKPTHPGS